MSLKKDIVKGVITVFFVAVAAGITYNADHPTSTVASFIIMVAVVIGWSIYKNSKKQKQ